MKNIGYKIQKILARAWIVFALFLPLGAADPLNITPEFLPDTDAVQFPKGHQQEFQVEINDPGELTLTYKWFHNGSPVGGNLDTFSVSESEVNRHGSLLRVEIWENALEPSSVKEWDLLLDLPSVTEPIEISTGTLPVGTEMVEYDIQLTASGGNGSLLYYGNNALIPLTKNRQQLWQSNMSSTIRVEEEFPIAVRIDHEGGLHLLDKGNAPFPSIPNPFDPVRQLSLDRSGAVALMQDGSVIGWDENGSHTYPVSGNVLQVGKCRNFIVCLHVDGTVSTWKAMSDTPHLPQVGFLRDVLQITSAEDYFLALDSSGSVHFFGTASVTRLGSSYYSVSNLPEFPQRPIWIAAGVGIAGAILEDKSVYVWGNFVARTQHYMDPAPPFGGLIAGNKNFLAISQNGVAHKWGDRTYKRWGSPFYDAFEPEEALFGDFHSLLGISSTSFGIQKNVEILPGLHLSPEGRITGKPQVSGEYTVAVAVQDEWGNYAFKALTVSIAPQANQRPVVNTFSPGEQQVSMSLGETKMFSVTATDPEEESLSYAWFLDGEPIGENSPVLSFKRDQNRYAGDHVLSCRIRDDIWEEGIEQIWNLSISIPDLQHQITTLPDMVEMQEANLMLAAKGGLPPYRWFSPGRVVQWGAPSEITSIPESQDNVIEVHQFDGSWVLLHADNSVTYKVKYQAVEKVGPLPEPRFVAVGEEHVIYTTANGDLAGNGTYFSYPLILPNEDLPPLVRISSAQNLSAGVTEEGAFRAWGSSFDAGTPLHRRDIVDGKAGYFQRMALTRSGEVLVWGSNSNGESEPPEELKDIVGISTKYSHCLALDKHGKVYSWGFWAEDANAVPEDLDNVRMISAAMENIALRNDGTVRVWGHSQSDEDDLPDDLQNVQFVSVAAHPSMGDAINYAVVATELPRGMTLQPDGTFRGAPRDAGTYEIPVFTEDIRGVRVKQLYSLTVHPSENLRPVLESYHPTNSSLEVALGETKVFSVTVNDPEGKPLSYEWTLNGEVVGDDSSSFTFIPENGDTFETLSIRCMIKDDLWEDEVFQEWEVTVILAPLQQTLQALPAAKVMEAYEVQLAGTGGIPPYRWYTSGKVVGWGLRPELADHPDTQDKVIEISQNYDAFMVLKEDFSMFYEQSLWGPKTGSLPAQQHPRAIGTGEGLVYATEGEGQLWEHPQRDFRDYWIAYPDLQNVLKLDATQYYGYALSADGQLAMLGNWQTVAELEPTGEFFVDVKCSYWDASAVTLDGRVLTWGDSTTGYHQIPDDLEQVISLAGDYGCVVALQRDGTVRQWGNAFYSLHRYALPELSDVVQVSAGVDLGLALHKDGTVSAWGRNRGGNKDIPWDLENVQSIHAGPATSFAIVATDLPKGMKFRPDGKLVGTPTESGVFTFAVFMEDVQGFKSKQEYSLTVEGSSNSKPLITSSSPSGLEIEVSESSSTLFEFTALDPENASLRYQWSVNGQPVGSNQTSFAFRTHWGDAGTYTIEADIRDDFWQKAVSQKWKVTVLADNDGDGVSNEHERDVNRNPDNAEDQETLATISGTVSDPEGPLADAMVSLFSRSGKEYYSTQTGNDGTFSLSGVSNGDYLLRFKKFGYLEQWWSGISYVQHASLIQLTDGTVLNQLDATLSPGKQMYPIYVTSNPAGAEIYLNFEPTGVTTPGWIDLPDLPRSMRGYAPTVVYVDLEGYPRPEPAQIWSMRSALPAPIHFDLESSPLGKALISSSIEGVEVYLNRTDQMLGVTPLLIENLQVGIHNLVLRKEGYALPPVCDLAVRADETSEIDLEFIPVNHPDAVNMQITSTPDQASVKINYLPTGEKTQVNYSTVYTKRIYDQFLKGSMHRVSVSKEGYFPPLIKRKENGDAAHFDLIAGQPQDPDQNSNGLPDDWEQLFQLSTFVPGEDGPEDDPDGDGMTTSDEQKSGTHPLDPDSVLKMNWMDLLPDNGIVHLSYRTVPGKLYVLQHTESLEGTWQDSGDMFQAAQQETVLEAAIPANGRVFFRLRSIHR